MLYDFIGLDVSDVKIKKTGDLEIYFGEKMISISEDDENFEEIWTISSDDPSIPNNSKWSLSLIEKEGLNLYLPE